MLLDLTDIPEKRWPNGCLACPAHWNRGDGDLETPVFPVPVERLQEAVLRVAAAEPRTQLLRLDHAARQAEFEQRSRIFRFPDTITVVFEPLGHERSGLAIFSRARYGFYDFGVNRRRVQCWLAALRAALGEVPGAATE